MKEVKTSSGFVCTVNEDARRDWRLLDALDDAQSENMLTRLRGIRSLCKMLLNEDGYKALQQHLAEPSGVVDMHAMEREIIEIFGQMGDGSSKN